MNNTTIHRGDLIAHLRGRVWLVENGYISKAHAVLCDPPYGLAFMNQKWDAMTPHEYQQWCTEWGRLLLAFVHPGAVMLCFGGTRTYHRLAAGLEDAGWIVSDCISWIYASGFPKSLAIGKAIDKVAPRQALFKDFAEHYAQQRKAKNLTHSKICEAGKFYANHNHGGASVNWEQGYNVPTPEQWNILKPLLNLSDDYLPLIKRVEAERQKVGEKRTGDPVAWYAQAERTDGIVSITAPATDAARQWESHGTSLSPSYEPVILAQSPSPPLTFSDIAIKIIADHIIAILEVKECLRLLSSVSIAETNLKPNQPKSTGAVQNTVAKNALGFRNEEASGATVQHVATDSTPQSQALNTDIAPIALSDVLTRLEGFRAQITEIGEGGDLQPLLDMFPLELTGIIDRNTLSSWRGLLADLLNHTSKFTTEMASRMIIDLKILNSLLYQVISESITQSKNNQTYGQLMSASIVAENLSAVKKKWSNIPALFAQENAISKVSDLDFAPEYLPIVLARAPWAGTYAGIAQEHGTGALNIEGARIGTEQPIASHHGTGGGNGHTTGAWRENYQSGDSGKHLQVSGRWPKNLILGCACESDDHDATCPVAIIGAQTPERTSGPSGTGRLSGGVNAVYNGGWGKVPTNADDNGGSAARFYFQAKSARWEREAGLHQRAAQTVNDGRDTPIDNPYQRGETERLNIHPTCKPIRLTEYLARLILPPTLSEPRRLLVPFSGSGSEMIGAQLAGWENVTGFEQSDDYADIAQARIAWWAQFSDYDMAKRAYDADIGERQQRETEAAHGLQQLTMFGVTDAP